MGFLDFFKRRHRRPTERQRRERLLRQGRIAEGTIIDSETNAEGAEIAFYLYTVNGVDFESTDILTERQRREIVKYSPGAKVSIRFDPRNPNNSVLE